MELKLNAVIEDAHGAVISAWLAREGDQVKEGQDLFEIVTDKATFDVASPCDGVLEKILKKAGSEIGPCDVIAKISRK